MKPFASAVWMALALTTSLASAQNRESQSSGSAAPPSDPPASVASAPPPSTEPPAAVSPPPPRPAAAETADEHASWLPEWTGTRRRTGRFNEVGVVVGNIGSLGVPGRASGSPMTGLRFYEHHGLLTKFTLGLITALATSSDKVVDSRETKTVGNTRVEITRYHYKTPEEREADRQAVAGAMNGEYVTELQLYTDGLLGAGSGQAERIRGGDFYLGGMWTGPFVGAYPSIIDVAFVYSHNRAANVLFKDGQRADVTYDNLGVMLRYQLPLSSFAELLFQADVNIYGLLRQKEQNLVRGTPLRVGAYLNLTDRLYARPMLSYTTGTSGGPGKLVEVGVRF